MRRGLFRIVQQAGDACGEVFRKLCRVRWEGRHRVRIERDQVPGLFIDDDLQDPAGCARDYGSPARHGLQVDDAEGLIHRRAAEDGAVRVELDGLLARDHLLNPDEVVAGAGGVAGGDGVAAIRRVKFSTAAALAARRMAAHGLHLRAHLRGNLGRVRSSRAQHDLRARRKILNRIDQMRHALLPRDAPHKQHVRLARDRRHTFPARSISGVY